MAGMRTVVCADEAPVPRRVAGESLEQLVVGDGGEDAGRRDDAAERGTT